MDNSRALRGLDQWLTTPPDDDPEDVPEAIAEEIASSPGKMVWMSPDFNRPIEMTPERKAKLRDFLEAVEDEVEDARSVHPEFHSHHEAYAVILEEVDEYWAEVKRKLADRDDTRLMSELVQIAAMVTCAAIELVS